MSDDVDPKETRDRLVELTAQHGFDIPAEELDAAGISKDDYATWRMDLADEEEDLRDLSALSDAVEAVNRRGSLPLRGTPEEVARIERGEKELEAWKKRWGEAEWERDDEPAS